MKRPHFREGFEEFRVWVLVGSVVVALTFVWVKAMPLFLLAAGFRTAMLYMSKP
jgi:hypothetical protein